MHKRRHYHNQRERPLPPQHRSRGRTVASCTCIRATLLRSSTLATMQTPSPPPITHTKSDSSLFQPWLDLVLAIL